MMKSVNSHKFQESISYYTEDIDYCENGKRIAPGVGDRTGEEYDMIFDEDGRLLVDITLHNQL